MAVGRKNGPDELRIANWQITALALLMVWLWIPAVAAPSDLSFKTRLVLNRAQKLMAKKKADEAVRLLTEFGADAAHCKGEKIEGPCHPMVAFALGNAFSMQQKFPEAAAQYLRAVDLDPVFSEAWQNLARVRYETGKYVEAGDAFFSAWDSSEEKTDEILYNAAVSFLAGNAPERSLEMFQRLQTLASSPLPLEWQEGLARTYLALKRPEPALELLKGLAEKTSGERQRQWRQVLLHQYLELGMKDQALAFSLDLTRQAPEDPVWWKALAHLYLIQDRQAQALAALTIYGHLTPLNPREKELAADLNLQLEIPEQAVALYREIAGEKNDLSVVLKIVAALRRTGRPELALTWVEKSLVSHPRNKDLLLSRGDLLFEMTRYREAAAAYAALTRSDPNQGRAWLMMGYAAIQAGDMKTARTAMNRAVDHAGQKEAAGQALQYLDQAPRALQGG